MELLTHLRRAHGRDEDSASPRKITLQAQVAERDQARLAAGPRAHRQRRGATQEDLPEPHGARGRAAPAAGRSSTRQRQAEEAVRAEAERRENEARERSIANASVSRQRPGARPTTRRAYAPRKSASARRSSANASAPSASAPKPERRPPAEAAPPPRPPKRARARGRSKGATTKYGRQELHVAVDASARFKKKQAQRGRRHVQVNVDSRHGFELPTAPVKRDVQLPETITVGELAQRMAVKANEVIKVMMKMGVMATINQPIDQDTAQLVVEEFGHTVVRTARTRSRTSSRPARQKPTPSRVRRSSRSWDTSTTARRRCSTTSAARRSLPARRAASRSTSAPTRSRRRRASSRSSTRRATPRSRRCAHAARTSPTSSCWWSPPTTASCRRRSRRSSTRARPNVPIVVAVNKIDKGDADPDRVRNDLAKQNVIPEDWGGDTLFVNVSARTGRGHRPAARDDPAAGRRARSQGADRRSGGRRRARVEHREGSRRRRDGARQARHAARRRSDHRRPGVRPRTRAVRCHRQARSTRPARRCRCRCSVFRTRRTPATSCSCVESERKAREVALYRQGKFRDVRLAAGLEEARRRVLAAGRSRSDDDPAHRQGGRAGQRRGVARCALASSATDDVSVKVIASGVGGITESDVTLAVASQARIIGFNVRADAAARTAIKDSGIDVRYYSIIYEAIDDVKLAVSGMLKPEIKEQIVGLARGARGVPLEQVRHGGRLPRRRRLHQARQPRPRAARQRRDPPGRARFAAALQGRRQRGARRHRVRHRRAQLQRRARRRPDRVLRARRGRRAS